MNNNNMKMLFQKKKKAIQQAPETGTIPVYRREKSVVQYDTAY